MPVSPGTRRQIWWPVFLAVLTLSAALTGRAAAEHGRRPDPIVITAKPVDVTPDMRVAVGRGASGAASTTTTAVPCTQPPPDATFTCQAGVWAAGSGGTASAGGGGTGRAAGCTSAQPGGDFVCQNGMWVSSTVAAGSTTTTTSTNATPDKSCGGTPPSVGWVCGGNGAWIPQSLATSQSLATPPSAPPGQIVR